MMFRLLLLVSLVLLVGCATSRTIQREPTAYGSNSARNRYVRLVRYPSTEMFPAQRTFPSAQMFPAYPAYG
ncbi:unnamed protein product [Anisakis simplex]|uniref:Lipoprotein n=1 Tax=Anisakis simplex TaxID=6269 RepID=A0A0M3J2G4_ANISI|nr:unnamed protein product [Anisakis simplex]VDK31284.1 unnamed protein product [Anisakis simplex]